MYIPNVTIQDIPPYPKTIGYGVNHACKADILASVDAETAFGSPMDINATTIQTILIQMTGRFCEHYASDLLITMSELQPFLHQERVPEWDEDKPHRWILGVGIREMGVDGNTFIMQRIAETKSSYGYLHPNHIYRKILAIDITDTRDDTGVKRSIQLVDISRNLYTIIPEDTDK